MSFFDLVIKDGTALISHASGIIEQQTDIGIRNGLISKIGHIEKKQAKKIFSAKNLYVLPGLMDCQVHFREPGMEHKENFETGSRSALLGGITGVLEMPNTSPPTINKVALQDKRTRAEGRFYCDYSFFLGACPENKNKLSQLENHPGCCGVKIFMGSSTGPLILDKEEDLEMVIKNGKRRVALHCEDEKRLIERKHFIKENDPSSHALWRDEKTALFATQKAVRLAKKHKRPIHILHVTTQEEIEFLAQNKDTATVEVTPQHLTLTAPSCYKKWKTLVQMNPPIREQRHFQALWKAVQNNIVDIIGSDHAPHTLDEKNKPYPESPSGLPGVQTLLPLLLHHRKEGRLNLKSIVKLLALNPKKYFKMKKRGSIKQDFIANFTLIDLKKIRKITKDRLAYRCGWSPFEDMVIHGWPTAVILHGQLAMQNDEVLEKPLGQEINFE